MAAVLAGLGVAELLRRRAWIVAVIAAAVMLSMERACSRSEEHYWRSSLAARSLASAKRIVEASTWLRESPPPVPLEPLERAARAEASRAADLDRFFELAVTLDTRR